MGTRAGQAADLLDLGRLEAGRADDRPRAPGRDQAEVLEGRLRRGELHQDAAGGEKRRRVGGDRHAQVARAGDLARVLPEAGWPGRSKAPTTRRSARLAGAARRCRPPMRPAAPATTSSTTGGTGAASGSAGRRPGPAPGGASPGSPRVMGHMGSRHSARIIPSMAIASFTGIGFVSMNMALQTG